MIRALPAICLAILTASLLLLCHEQNNVGRDLNSTTAEELEGSTHPQPCRECPPGEMPRIEVRVESMSDFDEQIDVIALADGRRLSIDDLFQELGFRVFVDNPRPTRSNDWPYRKWTNDEDLSRRLNSCLNRGSAQVRDAFVVCAFIANHMSAFEPDDDGSGRKERAVSMYARLFDTVNRRGIVVYRHYAPNAADIFINIAHELAHVLDVHHEDHSGSKVSIESSGVTPERIEHWGFGEASRVAAHEFASSLRRDPLPIFSYITREHCARHPALPVAPGVLRERAEARATEYEILDSGGSLYCIGNEIRTRQIKEPTEQETSVVFVLDLGTKVSEPNRAVDLRVTIWNRSDHALLLPESLDPTVGESQLSVFPASGTDTPPGILTNPGLEQGVKRVAILPGKLENWTFQARATQTRTLFPSPGRYRLQLSTTATRENGDPVTLRSSVSEIDIRVREAPKMPSWYELIQNGSCLASLRVGFPLNDECGALFSGDRGNHSLLIDPLLPPTNSKWSSINIPPRDDKGEKPVSTSSKLFVIKLDGRSERQTIRTFDNRMCRTDPDQIQLDGDLEDFGPGEARILLEGHTDSVGSCRFNHVLGLRRALWLKSALIKNGIRDEAILTSSCGRDYPGERSDPAEMRRVEMRVLSPGQQVPDECSVPCSAETWRVDLGPDCPLP